MKSSSKNIKDINITLKRRTSVEPIEKLEDNEVFVFGSNLAGRHGAGAARLARMEWGAKYGIGEGPTGQTYALPTCDEDIEPLPLSTIRESIHKFLLHTIRNADKEFLVTKIGCGLGGYTPKEIAPLFPITVLRLENVHLPEEFWHHIFLEKFTKL